MARSRAEIISSGHPDCRRERRDRGEIKTKSVHRARQRWHGNITVEETLRIENTRPTDRRPESRPVDDRGRRHVCRQVRSNAQQDSMKQPEVVRSESSKQAAGGTLVSRQSAKKNRLPKANKGKISVECPHCGTPQMEPASAKSTYCRKCSRHIDLEKPRLSGPPEATPQFPQSRGLKRLLGPRDDEDRPLQQVRGDTAGRWPCKIGHLHRCGIHMDLRGF